MCMGVLYVCVYVCRPSVQAIEIQLNETEVMTFFKLLCSLDHNRIKNNNNSVFLTLYNHTKA